MATKSLSTPSEPPQPIEAISELVSNYAAAQSGKSTPRDEFLLAVALMQAAQKLFTHTSSKRAELQASAAKVFTALGALPWNSVNFPVSSTLLSQTYADIFTENNVQDEDKYKVLLEGLYTFLVLLQDNPDIAQENVLRGIVTDSAQKTQAVLAPTLNYRANILKIFTPNKVAAIDLEPLHVVIYRGELIGGGFGPELWGLAYIKGDVAHVILETGEYVKTPAASLCLAATKDYDTSELPPYLLACAKLFVPTMILQLAEDSELVAVVEKLNKVFGNFAQFVPNLIAAKKDIETCAQVIDKERWARNDTQADGAMRSFDIPSTNLQVIVTAQAARLRPYITTTLVEAGNGKIFMRLDTPREFSACGVYLFPLGDKSVSLIVV